MSVGDFHLPNLVAYALAGEPRGDDARMLELLEPYRGQRARVMRLLELSGIRPPRYGPRLSRRAGIEDAAGGAASAGAEQRDRLGELRHRLRGARVERRDEVVGPGLGVRPQAGGDLVRRPGQARPGRRRRRLVRPGSAP